ncbi:cytochrome P450 [Tanacetum coccineum]
MKATADSIFKVAFGVDLDNLSGSNKEGVNFSRAFDDSNELTYRRLVDLFWKIKRYLNVGAEAELRKNIKVVDDFVYKVINTKTEQMQKPQDEFLITDKDPKYFRDIIINFVLAGKDPIATTMTWFIYILCKHPEIQDKIAQDIKEAMSITEDITNVTDFEALLSEDMLEKMHYLHAALAEIIRLYPALPLDPKICFSDDVLPDGCIVKKGDMIAYLPYAMGRMEFIWGEDALDYKPERWLDNNGCFHSESPFKFTAFQTDEDLLIYFVGLLYVQA